MAMSFVAATKAAPTSSASRSPSEEPDRIEAPIATHVTARASWAPTIQRLVDARRSTRGDQTNLKSHGAWSSEASPTTSELNPASVRYCWPTTWWTTE